MFIAFRENGMKEGGGEKEKNIDVWEKHWLVASCMHPNRGENPQPRYVPWPGIDPRSLLVYGMMLQTTEPPSQGSSLLLNTLLVFNHVKLLYIHKNSKRMELKNKDYC